MSNKRFIHISSAYRNRKRFPLQSQFEIPISQTGNKLDSLNAYDPIVDSYPIYQFKGSFITSNEDIPGNIVSKSNPEEFFLNGSRSSNINNFYSGYGLKITAINNVRQILRYDAPSSTVIMDRSTQFLGSASNYNFVDLSRGSALYNSSGTFGNSSSLYEVIIPNPSDNILSYTKPEELYNMTITNLTLNETRTITSFAITAPTAKITVSQPFSQNVSGHNYTIQPSEYTVTLQPYDYVTRKEPSGINQYYNGMYLVNETINEYRKITKYNAITRTLTIDSPFSGERNRPNVGWKVTDTYSIRKEIPVTQNNFIGVPNTTKGFNIVQLNPAGAVSTNYTGNYLFPRQGTDIYQITNHDLTTNEITIVPTPSSTFQSNSNYDILQFSRDTLFPMTYSGTQLNAANYEVELLDLILPNVELKTGTRASFYPCFFVEFSSSSGSNTIDRNVIYSNNPNSVKQLFVPPMDDSANPLTTKYIKLGHSAESKQTIRFNPYDNLYISITLPNGEPFETLAQDNLSPLPPNPELQLYATFGIKRL